jgi:transposase
MIRSIRLDSQTVTLVAHGRDAKRCCPDCGTASGVVHDRYQRRPLDLPWRGQSVRLLVTVRRFRCPNAQCDRLTFAEDFGAGLPHRAQRTAAAAQLLLQFGAAAGGEAGARLAHAGGLPVSPDTLLRLLRRAVLPVAATPRVLGIDDLALRRGRTYATLFVDLETHRPIDLLPERDAAMVAQWLRAHPGVEIVVRDRAEAYAHGVREGAPDAQQVADRFHLLQNASAALDQVVRSRRRHVEVAEAATETDAGPTPTVAPRPPSRRQQHQADARARRSGRWEAVRARHAGGQSIRGIARELGMHRSTVHRLLETPDPPRNRPRSPPLSGLRSPSLQPYMAYLQGRWQAGCTNISQLFRELVAQGYNGSRSLLYQALQPWRGPRPASASDGRRGQPRVRRRSLRWLCLRPPDQLSTEERAALDQVLAEDTHLAQGYDLLQRFRTLVATRDVAALDRWLTDAHSSALPSFVTLATGIQRDRAAVEAALTLPWSTGMVEGHVHRVKLIKRQGYGRATLDLLRRHVLAA